MFTVDLTAAEIKRVAMEAQILSSVNVSASSPSYFSNAVFCHDLSNLFVLPQHANIVKIFGVAVLPPR